MSNVPVTFESYVDAYADEVSRLMRNEETLKLLSEVDRALYEAYKNKRDVFVFGNGGSAAVADHFMCDHVKLIHDSEFGKLRPRVRSLCADTHLITAIANDVSYDDVFSSQLIWHYDEPGLVVAMSVSGSSPNVIEGLQTARHLAHTTVALVGKNGGRIVTENLADHVVTFPSYNFGVVEDCFSVAMHSLAQWMVTSC